MFKKLHRQLTFFCSVVTGAILVALSLVCLLLAKKAIMQTGYTAFQKELVSVITSLQSQNYISHQWLKQMQQQHHFAIYLYDNGEPIYYDRLQSRGWEDLRNAVLEQMDTGIFSGKNGQTITHEEQTWRASAKETYYVSAGSILRTNGSIRFVILYDTSHQTAQILHMTIGILTADVVTLLLLILFSWIFTGRVVQPLEAAQKKQQQFVAAASHELRAPLAVMLSGLETVEKAASTEERHHFLSLIQQEGLRMQHLITDMLVLANADARGIILQTAATAPDDLLLCVYEKYENLARSKGISLQFLLPDTAYRDCILDRERITQVLSILMDNALSYTPQGGKILLSATQSARHTTFAVADDGPSIPDAQKTQIFERFYRADPSHTDHGHFGLGLCTAKEIIRAHHGIISAQDLSDCALLPDEFPSGHGVVFLVVLRESP